MEKFVLKTQALHSWVDQKNATSYRRHLLLTQNCDCQDGKSTPFKIIIPVFMSLCDYLRFVFLDCNIDHILMTNTIFVQCFQPRNTTQAHLYKSTITYNRAATHSSVTK